MESTKEKQVKAMTGEQASEFVDALRALCEKHGLNQWFFGGTPITPSEMDAEGDGTLDLIGDLHACGAFLIPAIPEIVRSISSMQKTHIAQELVESAIIAATAAGINAAKPMGYA